MKLTPHRKRTIARVLHLAVTMPLSALVYAPEAFAMAIRPAVQFGLFPLLAITGLWMWQGHRLGQVRARLASPRPNGQPAS